MIQIQSDETRRPQDSSLASSLRDLTHYMRTSERSTSSKSNGSLNCSPFLEDVGINFIVQVASHSYSGSALDVFFQYSTLYNCNFNGPCHGFRRHLDE